MHIRADNSRWDFYNLVTVPSRELLQFKSLISNIVFRDLKVRYKGSFLGVIWTILAPLMSMTVLWAVFTYAMKIQIPNYAAYLLSGIISWNLFIQSSTAGGASILGAAALIRKVRLPRVVFPMAVVVNNIVNFGFAFIALIIVMLLSKAPIHLHMFPFIPLALAPLVLFSAGWAMLVSSLTVFFRDLQYIIDVFLGALFYATPILYSAEMLPENVLWVVSLNPIAKYIHIIRTVVYSGQIPAYSTYFTALGISILVFCLGWIVFHRLQKKFVYWL